MIVMMRSLGFGPAWLKSLGATSFEEEAASHLEQPAPSLSPLSTESGNQEQPVAYASQNAFEAELQEQPAVYDPWKDLNLKIDRLLMSLGGHRRQSHRSSQ